MSCRDIVDVVFIEQVSPTCMAEVVHDMTIVI